MFKPKIKVNGKEIPYSKAHPFLRGLADLFREIEIKRESEKHKTLDKF